MDGDQGWSNWRWKEIDIDRFHSRLQELDV